MDELLDIAAVAEYLGVSDRTVYNRVRSGELPAIKVGRLWRVRKADLEAWLGTRDAHGGVQETAAGESGAGLLLLRRHRAEIVDACRRHHVRRLDVFGSVLRDDFTPTSDIDFLVEFEPVEASGFDHPYWALSDELEAILGRCVDVVMVNAVTNPYLADELERTRVALYAA
ncbi:MAG: helix-turn-helix domain-containing protein [Coriobacteriia bacterium]|nr:helix-turn-helix domain-containing protein [Coriobacteriia bacterium]